MPTESQPNVRRIRCDRIDRDVELVSVGDTVRVNCDKLWQKGLCRASGSFFLMWLPCLFLEEV
jgi:hypothetical protein